MMILYAESDETVRKHLGELTTQAPEGFIVHVRWLSLLIACISASRYLKGQLA